MLLPLLLEDLCRLGRWSVRRGHLTKPGRRERPFRAEFL
jgi:hypothetical protein